MHISAGCQMTYDCPQPTPMLLTISPHPSREPDLLAEVATHGKVALARGKPEQVAQPLVDREARQRDPQRPSGGG